MATYDIAPANTGSEIGLAQMRYGLSASADYNTSNIYSAGSTDMQTLVVNSTTYQSNLTSKTWNTSTPYGFAEMAGQTWDDAVAATLSYNIASLIGGTVAVTIRVGGPAGTIIYNGGPATGTISSGISSGDNIYVACNINHPSDPYNATGEYRVPDSGTYTQLFFQSSGPSGGTIAPSGTFTITSGQTTAGFVLSF